MRSNLAGVVLISFVPVAGLSACVSSSPGGGSYRIASASVRSDIINMARAEGILNGEANADGSACFWLGPNNGAQALSWPFGYTAGGSPLSVYDDSGRSVASVGHHVVFAGGLLPDSVHSILGCHGFTNFWGVGEVVSADGN